MPDQAKQNIVFVYVPGGDFAEPQHHLGVSYMRAAVSASEGVTSSQIVAHPAAPAGWYRDAVVSRSPALVGFTVYDHNFLVTAAISRMVREKLPGVPIVFGGPTATFSAGECLQACPWVDACVEGEGESTAPELLAHYSAGGREAAPEQVRGVHFRRKNEIGYSGERPLAGLTKDGQSCLDILPSPYLTGILSARNRAGILTSRGCVFQCTFCNFTAMSRFRIRHFSIQRVLAELESIASTATRDEDRYVSIYDDAFAIHLARGKEILRQAIQARLGLRLGCMVRADLVDEEFLELLAQAKCTYVSFGLESTSPEVLRRAGKVQAPACAAKAYSKERQYIETVRQKVAMASRLGMDTNVSVILGLPGDTLESARKTLTDVRAMSATFYTHNLLSVYPGTALFERREEFGLALEDGGQGPPYATRWSHPVDRLNFDASSRTSRHSLRMGLRVARILANTHSGGADLYQVPDGIWSLTAWSDIREHGAFVRDTVAQLGTLVHLDPGGRNDVNWRLDTGSYGLSHLYYYGTEGAWPSFRESREAVRLRSLRQNVANYFPTFLVGPYASFSPEPRRFMGGTGEPFEIRMASCFDRRDVNQLCEDVVNSPTAQDAFQKVAGRCDFLMDSCRWADCRCGAMRPSGLASDENRQQRVCYSGPAFPMGTPVADVSSSMRAAVEAARQRRRCETCELDGRCSYCPFPGCLTEEEFCGINRTMGGRRRAVGRGPLGHTLRFLDEAVVEAR